MKTMKRFASVLLALVMVMGMTVTSFADETTYTLTLNEAQAGHTYTAYQIFAGDLSEGILSNIVWGSGVNAEGKSALGNAATKAETLETTEDAEAFAAAVASYLADGTESTAVTDGTCTISGLNAGYYLIQTTATPEEDGVKTYYIMKVVKDTTATIKADAPEVKKEVDDKDLNIGDPVNFTLTATMPSKLDGYKTYKVVFHDTMSAGLTFGEITKVTVNGVEKETGYVLDPTTPVAGEEFTITFADVIEMGAAANSEIVVTYTATLNENAVIGTEGNPNKVYLEYSNNPNGEGTGKTPEKEVVVYTWDMEVLKYADGNESKVLAGVKFILLNKDANKIAKVADGKIVSWDPYTGGMDVTTYELITDANGKISISGLESGDYLLRETQELPGYNKLDGDKTVTVDNNDDGKYETLIAKVNNNSGATLPETGGMGTTIFYALGAALMLGAGVLLVTKKRMGE